MKIPSSNGKVNLKKWQRFSYTIAIGCITNSPSIPWLRKCKPVPQSNKAKYIIICSFAFCFEQQTCHSSACIERIVRNSPVSISPSQQKCDGYEWTSSRWTEPSTIPGLYDRREQNSPHTLYTEKGAAFRLMPSASIVSDTGSGNIVNKIY